eukprot:19991_1
MALLSPQNFAPQFQNHFFPSSSIYYKYEPTALPQKSPQNLFTSKEQKVNNLMNVNIIFKRNIQLFYEFYCIQLYLTKQMISILKQLCIENQMDNDIPSDHELIQGFNDIFVVPIYQQLIANIYNTPQLPNDQIIMQKLQVYKYPMCIKTQIENIAYHMALLIIFACNELELNNEEKVMDYIDEFKSVSHHTLKLNLLGYKRWLNELTVKYCCYNVIIGYIHKYCPTNNDEMKLQIKQVISMFFYCPFGYNKTNEEIKELIYGTFQSACGNPISLLLGSIINSVMEVHMLLSNHSIEKKKQFDVIVVEELWD